MRAVLRIAAFSLLITFILCLLGENASFGAKSTRKARAKPQVKSSTKPADSGLSSEKEFANALNLVENKSYSQAIKVLDSLITKSANPEMKGKHFYLRANCYRQTGNWKKAISDYQLTLKQNEFPFVDRAKFNIAAGYKNLNDNKSAIVWYETVVRDHPGTLIAMDALFQLGELCFKTKKYELAITYYTKFIASYPNGSRARIAMYRIGSAYQELKKWPEAYAQYYRVIQLDTKDWITSNAADRIRLLISSHPEIVVTREARMLIAKTLLSSKQYANARGELKKLIIGADDLSAEAAYYMADSYYLEGKYSTAIAEYTAFGKRYPKNSYAVNSQYQFALCQLKLGKVKEFKSLMTRFAATYPYSELADDAEFKIAEYYLDKGQCKEATDAYTMAIDKYPASDLADDALWDIGWCNMKLKNNEISLKAFKRLSSEYPQSPKAGQACFWAGVNAERLGNWQDAFGAYKESMKYGEWYYSVRARNRAELLIENKKIIDEASSIQSEEYKRVRFDESVPAWKNVDHPISARTRELLELRLFDDATNEFLAAIEASVSLENAYYNLSVCYARMGEYNRAWSYAWKLSELPGMKSGNGAMPRQIYQLLYPLAYREAIFKNSKENNLDPFLVSALIFEESRYNCNARSRVGATGLMQIMPLTGRDIASGLNIPGFDRVMLHSPETNIKMGTWYLNGLMTRFNEHVRTILSTRKTPAMEPDYYEIAKMLSLGAYNGGEGRVRRWMEHYGIDDIDEFVEKINLDETREYIKKVCDSYEIYKSLYSENPSE